MKSTKSRKTYKKIFIKPPQQLTTKWYFQHDLANFPLLVTMASAASFDRYYLSSDSISTTIGFLSLNTKIFNYHNFQNFPTTGYHPKQDMYLWATDTHMPAENYQQSDAQDLIYLGNTGQYDGGNSIKHINLPSGQTSWQQRWDHYFSNKQFWGNPFYSPYLNQDKLVLYSTKSPHELKTILTSNTTKIGANFQRFFDPFYYQCRYNPLNDTGDKTQLYLLSNIRDPTTLEPTQNKNLKIEGYPLWLSTWGWIDWQKEQREAQQPDINYFNVFKSPVIIPKMDYYIPIDKPFTNATSPYLDEHQRTAADDQHWYIKQTFQIQTMNLIASSGPGTIKLPGTNSCEAHMEYRFHFKLGGCPAPMEKVCDPSEQPIYPIPNNNEQTNSLQSPETPPEYFLYQFDEKRGQITKTAAERMLKDWESKDSSLSTTGTNLQLQPETHQSPPTSDEETTSEEEEETLQQKLNKQRHKQRLLKLKILQLLKTKQKFKIVHSKVRIDLFNDYKPTNRRMTPY